jgi:hypothetical protein
MTDRAGLQLLVLLPLPVDGVGVHAQSTDHDHWLTDVH